MAESVRPGRRACVPAAQRGVPESLREPGILLVLLLALVLGGCSRREAKTASGEATAVPQEGGVLRVLHEETNVYDPVAVDDSYEATVVNQIYEGLVELDGDLGVRPCLARSWTMSEDGRCYRFVLRRGVRFHDGRPLDAATVVRSLERTLRPDRDHACLAETYLLSVDGAVDYRAGRTPHIAGLRAGGADTVEVRLVEPLGYFLYVMCMDQLKVVPLLAPGETPDSHPIGTGPWHWVDRSPGGDIRLARFPDYWGDKARADSLIFVVPDRELSGAEEISWLVQGRVHVVPIGAARRAMVEQLGGFRILRFPDFSVTFIGLNAAIPPLDRPEVRQAIAMAVNRSELLTPVAATLINPATGILPPRMAGYQPDVKTLPYDPEKARALLREAGYDASHPLPPIDFYTGGPDTSRQERELVRQFAEIGVKLRVHTLDWPSLDARIMAGRAPLFELSWLADIPDPDAFLYFLFHTGEPNNLFSYENATVDSLLEDARRMTHGPERFALYRRIESIVLSDVALIPLFNGITLYAWGPTVRSVDPNPFGFALTPFDRIWFAPEGASGDPVTERRP